MEKHQGELCSLHLWPQEGSLGWEEQGVGLSQAVSSCISLGTEDQAFNLHVLQGQYRPPFVIWGYGIPRALSFWGISGLRKRWSPSSHSGGQGGEGRQSPLCLTLNAHAKSRAQDWAEAPFRDGRILAAPASLRSSPWFSSLYTSFASSLLAFQSVPFLLKLSRVSSIVATRTQLGASTGSVGTRG